MQCNAAQLNIGDGGMSSIPKQADSALAPALLWGCVVQGPHVQAVLGDCGRVCAADYVHDGRRKVRKHFQHILQQHHLLSSSHMYIRYSLSVQLCECLRKALSGFMPMIAGGKTAHSFSTFCSHTYYCQVAICIRHSLSVQLCECLWKDLCGP